jgi:hypothetical protein
MQQQLAKLHNNIQKAEEALATKTAERVSVEENVEELTKLVDRSRKVVEEKQNQCIIYLLWFIFLSLPLLFHSTPISGRVQSFQ